MGTKWVEIKQDNSLPGRDGFVWAKTIRNFDTGKEYYLTVKRIGRNKYSWCWNSGITFTSDEFNSEEAAIDWLKSIVGEWEIRVPTKNITKNSKPIKTNYLALSILIIGLILIIQYIANNNSTNVSSSKINPTDRIKTKGNLVQHYLNRQKNFNISEGDILFVGLLGTGVTAVYQNVEDAQNLAKNKIMDDLIESGQVNILKGGTKVRILDNAKRAISLNDAQLQSWDDNEPLSYYIEVLDGKYKGSKGWINYRFFYKYN